MYAAGQTEARNLVGEIAGAVAKDQIVIVGAHYDSVKGTPGADDNASGIAALLALARHFARR
jgi:Zn-dependent M28 family amino/carboxypeptidase